MSGTGTSVAHEALVKENALSLKWSWCVERKLNVVAVRTSTSQLALRMTPKDFAGASAEFESGFLVRTRQSGFGGRASSSWSVRMTESHDGEGGFETWSLVLVII